MGQLTYPIIDGKVLRVTRLTACGVPAWGDYAMVVSEGFVSVAVTANYDDGEAIQKKNASGSFCVNRPARSEMESLGLEMVFCGVEPDTISATTGFPKIIDPATGLTIGVKVRRTIRPSDIKWALEVWSDATDSAGCDLGAFPYAYQLWPFLSGARLGDYTIENNSADFTITGATTQDGNAWGQGPYVVVTDELGDPSVLNEALDPDDHEWILRTEVPPPLPTDGLVPLDDPDLADAAGADAGTPGVWTTPDGGVRPEDLAALILADPTADPATAWTTGQYVILGDGSYAHWSSTAWVAGKA